jgi:hypothetical protein
VCCTGLYLNTVFLLLSTNCSGVLAKPSGQLYCTVKCCTVLYSTVPLDFRCSHQLRTCGTARQLRRRRRRRYGVNVGPKSPNGTRSDLDRPPSPPSLEPSVRPRAGARRPCTARPAKRPPAPRRGPGRRPGEALHSVSIVLPARRDGVTCNTGPVRPSSIEPLHILSSRRPIFSLRRLGPLSGAAARAPRAEAPHRGWGFGPKPDPVYCTILCFPPGRSARKPKEQNL